MTTLNVSLVRDNVGESTRDQTALNVIYKSRVGPRNPTDTYETILHDLPERLFALEGMRDKFMWSIETKIDVFPVLTAVNKGF